jgi:hypothetical protein
MDNNSTAQKERNAIEQAFDRAENKRDYPGSYFPALIAARKSLAAWREKWPAEAAAEDADAAERKAAAKARADADYASSFIGRGLD